MKEMEKCIYWVAKQEKIYPEKLKNIDNPPEGLYVQGRLPDKERLSIAIVGARNCTPYGKEMARYFGRELAAAGIQIISGLARGVDSSAHWGALEAEGDTFGILGCGIDICYPRENKKLFEKTAASGGILSEYEPGTPPLAAFFPQRNRIISGLCDGILVIEARVKSGSLITAAWGLEQGKDIFALPGRSTDLLSRGCNHLIRQGAALVETPEDILREYEWNGKYKEGKTEKGKKNNISLEREEKIVYSRLSLEPKHLNCLIEETKLTASQVFTALLNLELSGRITDIGGGYYVIVL